MFTLRVETVQATCLATIDCKLRWFSRFFLVSRLEFQLLAVLTTWLKRPWVCCFGGWTPVCWEARSLKQKQHRSKYLNVYNQVLHHCRKFTHVGIVHGSAGSCPPISRHDSVKLLPKMVKMTTSSTMEIDIGHASVVWLHGYHGDHSTTHLKTEIQILSLA